LLACFITTRKDSRGSEGFFAELLVFFKRFKVLETLEGLLVALQYCWLCG
jgi:hypothetical protein